MWNLKKKYLDFILLIKSNMMIKIGDQIRVLLQALSQVLEQFCF